MPQSTAIAVENNFSKGLITEATGLNFPENACTDTENCIFNFTGSVERRMGFDFEDNFVTKTLDRSNCALRTYLWRNVAGNGDLTVLVVQIGATIYFYKTNSSSLSTGSISSTVTLSSVSGAPTPEALECQFADGNGLLFITHQYCEPMSVTYDTSSDTATATNIILTIRDFEGATADALAVDNRPTSTKGALTASHLYNLYNQGWTDVNLNTWDTNLTTMPSNADVMWRFKNSSDAFDTGTVPNVVAGNTPAPKGHFVLTLSNQNRDAVAGTTGAASTTTSFQRPTTSAFFAGRTFYSGINYIGFNSSIYFTQIIERAEQYGFCYQTNDPSSEDEFDLLPSDGGVIRIQDAGTIFKLYSVPGGLAVFAANGVWFITGSTGIGFSANDYTVQKLTHIPTISSTSFVDVLGFPVWWNAEGIYNMTSQQAGSFPTISLLTDTTIDTFYNSIPLASKKYARGFYHLIEKKITWVYKSEDTSQLTNVYEFDRTLILNLRTGAFYPWIIADGTPNVHAVNVTDANTGATTVNLVVDSSVNQVQDVSSNNVISFSTSGSVSNPTEKYLVSYFNGTSYVFTFAETKNTQYVDWLQFDGEGINYASYFITGYKIRVQDIRKFGTNWVKIFSDISDGDKTYYFQGLWDYSTSGDTGRWSSNQLVTHPSGNYAVVSRRLKVRGHGAALQFKVQSVDGSNFNIIGWSTLDVGNASP